MTTYLPGPGESFADLVRDIVPKLAAESRAGVRVVTGGERAGLVVPEHATATPPQSATETPAEAPDGEAPATDTPAVKKRRAARRRTTSAKETL